MALRVEGAGELLSLDLGLGLGSGRFFFEHLSGTLK